MKCLVLILTLLVSLSSLANSINQFPVICGIFKGADLNKTDDRHYCDIYNSDSPFKIVAFTISSNGDIKKNSLDSKCFESHDEASEVLLEYQSLGICK